VGELGDHIGGRMRDILCKANQPLPGSALRTGEEPVDGDTGFGQRPHRAKEHRLSGPASAPDHHDVVVQGTRMEGHREE